jgi:hypothetical protein
MCGSLSTVATFPGVFSGCTGTMAARLSICNCAVDWPALTVMNTEHGPTLPAEGTMDAVPSWAVTTCDSDDPRRMGGPSPATCASVVAKVTLTPITGFSAVDPSVTRITSG